MSVGLRLDLRQSQQLVMTPQLQQAIKLLQMTNLELAEFVEREAEQNPLLEIERGDPPSADEPPAPAPSADPEPADSRVTADGDPALAAETFDTGTENLYEAAPADTPHRPGEHRASAQAHEDLPSLEERLAGRPGLREHLRAQIGQIRAAPPVPQIARYLVEELDEHGYLRADLGEVAGRLGTSLAEVEAALALLQSCEPTGVGARSVGECLALQLAERGRLGAAMRALLDNLGLIARGDWKRLRALCGVGADELSAMIRELRRLDPRPCAGFGVSEPETLVADVLLRRSGWGGWQVELNPETLPRVLIDRDYVARIGAGRDADARRWLADCQASANWLVRSIDQRARTILKTAAEIVRHQQRFFDEGLPGLRPLTLRTVAEAVGMHESTISRVTSNKYIATERGIFELRFFFTNALGDRDGEVAAEVVRHRIRAMVDAENPADILSDDVIVERLGREGVGIARRTVAKYRKSLNIPSSVERRRLKSPGGAGPAAAPTA